jgi:hypothetical protein
LDGAQHFRFAPNQWINLAVARLFVEVDAIRRKCVTGLFLFALGVGVFIRSADGAGLRHAGPFGDTMGDVLHGIEPRHLLLLQEISGMAFALGENTDEHVGAGDLFTARRLDMHDGALHHPLERICRLRIARRLGDQRRQLIIEIIDQAVAQLVKVDRAGMHHRRRVTVVDQRQQQVLKCCEFVPTHVRILKSAMQRSFQVL